MSKPKRKRSHQPKPSSHVSAPPVEIAAKAPEVQAPVEPMLTDAVLENIRAAEGTETEAEKLGPSDRVWFIGAVIALVGVFCLITWKIWKASHS